MKKIYLVDSENVGDVWVPLLASSQPEDELLVFYTQKSPHMSYENVRMLKETEREATFIKCFEGSNALDFQLVSELGFRLSQNVECEYIIVSNDTGFDAAVRYWSARKMPVARLSGKECYRNLVAKKQQAAENAAVEADETKEQEEFTKTEQSTGLECPACDTTTMAPMAALEETESREEVNVPSNQEEQEECLQSEDGLSCDAQPRELLSEETADEIAIVKNLFRCISKENLVDFHNALVALLGEEKGKAFYQEMKGNAEYTTYWADLPVSSQRERFDIYCSMVFAQSDFAADMPKDFASFLYQANGKRKNLNSLRAALQGHYGKDKGMKYYSLFKSHIKIMNRM